MGPQHEKPLQVNEPSPCLYQFYGRQADAFSLSVSSCKRPIGCIGGNIQLCGNCSAIPAKSPCNRCAKNGRN